MVCIAPGAVFGRGSTRFNRFKYNTGAAWWDVSKHFSPKGQVLKASGLSKDQKPGGPAYMGHTTCFPVLGLFVYHSPGVYTRGFAHCYNPSFVQQTETRRVVGCGTPQTP